MSNITTHVTSLELSRRLKELGVKNESYFDWVEFSLKIKEPLEPQLQTNSELVEVIYNLIK